MVHLPGKSTVQATFLTQDHTAYCLMELICHYWWLWNIRYVLHRLATSNLVLDCTLCPPDWLMDLLRTPCDCSTRSSLGSLSCKWDGMTWLTQNWTQNTHLPKWPPYSYTQQKGFALIKEILNASGVPGYTYIWNGLSWEVATPVTVKKTAFFCVTQYGHDNNMVGFYVCSYVCEHSQFNRCPHPSAYVTHGSFPLQRGALWIGEPCGWPYLSYHWIGRCTWGWPCIPAQGLPLLPCTPSKWERMGEHKFTSHKALPCLLVVLSISYSFSAVIDMETQVLALAFLITQAVNQTKCALSLLTEETTQIRKVVLENGVALDMLMAGCPRWKLSSVGDRVLCMYTW